ncbi:AMP-binding protein [Actinomadura rudentiformis]|uniref:AMP-binding protein n=1 Tax=Actinomadura rudentiformis TaxID=359158 RepID=UPI00178C3FFB|nr:AMP-binding protein [Actinomadura rudentiformis]
MSAAALDAATLAEAVRLLDPGVSVTFPSTGHSLTAADLDAASARFAHGLLAHGAGPGDIVGILAPTGPHALIALLGTVRAGAAASMFPMPAGAPGVVAERLAPSIQVAGIRHLVTHPDAVELAAELTARRPGLAILGTDLDAPGSGALPAVAPDALAVVQFTSGSTSRPKGVKLPHSTVMNGLRAIVWSSAITRRDTIVSWVPHFHDMGLFGPLAVLLAGGTAQLLSPLAFVRRPAAVLRLMSEAGGTMLTGPDFSYRRLATADLPPDLDLSRWRLAYNGAEPVRAKTVTGFTERIATAGVPASVMYPVYGMAEATLAIAFPEPGTAPKIVHVDRSLLADERRAVQVASDHPRAKTLVSVGRPVHGLRMRLMDGIEVSPGRLGEIEISGPAVTPGYLDDPSATAQAFDGPWLRTGDLGFRLGDDLFVTGRRKEMIIVRGQNHFPEDIEDIARRQPGVHLERCVAFADADAERLTVVAEIAPRTDPATLTARIRVSVADHLGLSAIDVHTVRPGWLPRTTSGKWQRDLTRRRIAQRG